MKSEWKTRKLADLGEIVGGATPSTKDEANYGGDIAWITPKDLSLLKGRFIARGERNISEKGLSSCSAKMMPKNSVLFSSRAPIGYVAISSGSVCTNQGFKSIVPNDNTDYMFLYYLLRYKKDAIEAMGSGTTFKEVSASTMRSVEVHVPAEKKEQERISSVLAAIDAKIEANDRINDNLQQQIQAVFKEWFVDSADAITWGKGTFSGLVEKTISGDWGKEAPAGNNTEKVYCIRGADIPEVRAGNKGKMPTRYILPKNFAAKKLVAGDIVVEISGGSPTQSTGRSAPISDSLLKRYDCGMVCTNFCKAIKPKQGYSMFIYYYWQYLYDAGVFFRYESGTTGIKNLNITNFLETEEIRIPPVDVLQRFDSICQANANMIYANGLENERLANLRDALIPKLMSGEMDVSTIDI